MLLGHVHTHEFACGGTTDQVGNPWALERSAGGSEWRVERGARVAAGARGDGHRHGRLAAHPLGRVRDIDDQADARSRLDARDRAACVDVRPSRADDPDRRATPSSLLAAMAGVGRAGLAAAAPPLRRLPTHLRPRAGRRRRVRSSARGASRRARRAAASGGTARRPRRLLRSRPHRDARLPPSLRRPARRVSPLESGAARARRAEGDDGRGVHRATGRPHRGHERLVRLARRAPHRRDRRADDPDRRTLAWQRVRRGRSATSRISRSRTTGTGRASPSSPCRPASGSDSGLPVSVSLIGAPGSDWDLLDWGAALQDELGTVSPP